MYRQYENPHALEEQLEDAQNSLARRLAEDPDGDHWDLYETIADLKERINFAYQDEEYDELHADPDWEQYYDPPENYYQDIEDTKEGEYEEYSPRM